MNSKEQLKLLCNSFSDFIKLQQDRLNEKILLERKNQMRKLEILNKLQTMP